MRFTPAHPIGDVPREAAGLVPDPVTVSCLSTWSATHIGEGRLNAIEYVGIYPPNREKWMSGTLSGRPLSTRRPPLTPSAASLRAPHQEHWRWRLARAAATPAGSPTRRTTPSRARRRTPSPPISTAPSSAAWCRGRWRQLRDYHVRGCGPNGVAFVECLTDTATAPPPTCAWASPATAVPWPTPVRFPTCSPRACGVAEVPAADGVWTRNLSRWPSRRGCRRGRVTLATSLRHRI